MAIVCILPASVRHKQAVSDACIKASLLDLSYCFRTVYNMHMWCTYNRLLAFLPKLTLMFSSDSQFAAALRRADQKEPDSGDGADIRSHCTLCVRHQPSGRMLNICQDTQKQVRKAYRSQATVVISLTSH